MKVRKMSCLVMGVCLSLLTAFIPSGAIAASGFDEVNRNEAVYNLIEGGTQQFEIEDANGQKICVTTISEMSNANSRIADKTYAVSYEKYLQWKAGYNLVIRNNSINTVNSAYVETYVGNFSNKRVVKESSKQATLYFNHNILGVILREGVRTQIVNNELKVKSI